MSNSLRASDIPDPAAQDLLAALVELLEQEYAALRRADGAAVTGITDAKRELTESLGAVGWSAAQNQTKTVWPAALTDLVRRCRDLNQRNGELLRLQQSMLTRVMRVLSGADASPALYGARGETRPAAGGRHIASV